MTEKGSGSTGSIAVRKLLLLPGVVISALILLAAPGCSDSGEESSSNGSGGADSGIVTGSAECDRDSMQEAVQSWADTFGGGEAAELPDDSDSFRCADGWAVAFPETGPKEAAVTVTAVFEAEGQFWVPKDRSKVCGDTAATSEVPESLYREACQTN